MELKSNQVFVFGCNYTGFHGAGSAGLACRGESKNTWRSDPWFLNAMKSPVGSKDRIGKWAIYGIAEGFQQGTEGKSYGIITIIHPGQRRSYSLEKIKEQIKKLFQFAREHPEYEFVMSPIGAGLAGYTGEEMMNTFIDAAKEYGHISSNMIIPMGLYKSVNILDT